LRQRFELGEGTQGVVITEVDADSSAAEKGIRAGDVIVEVAQEEVGSPSQVLDKVREVKKSSRKSVLLLVRRAENLRFVALRLKDS
jgi:serine protease Do